jgi:hypothetical protein
MHKVTFATFDPVVHDSPAFCEICTANAPIFRYELTGDENRGSATTGYCCGFCAPGFLRRLEAIEACQWEAEEAAIESAEIVNGSKPQA